MNQSEQPEQLKQPKPANTWTKEFELSYWNAKSDDYYLANIRQKYEFLAHGILLAI